MASSRPSDDANGMTDSWVELNRLNGSTTTTTNNGGSLRQSRHSPKTPISTSSPLEMVHGGAAQHQQLDFDKVRRRIAAEMPDAMWDWSSRPEAVPPRHYRTVPSTASGGGGGGGRRQSKCGEQTRSADTPPNSPVPSVGTPPMYERGSRLRHSSLAQSSLFRVDVLACLAVSNAVMFATGAWLGFHLYKHLRDQ